MLRLVRLKVEKFQVFEMDSKSMIEEKKRKYGHYHHISGTS